MRSGRLLVSFATCPDQGGESGVGWNFLRESARWCSRREEPLFAVIDARDHEVVRAKLAELGLLGCVNLMPVEMPKLIRWKVGSRRSRLAYMGWFFVARRVCRRLAREGLLKSAHQVTFATASLPPVIANLGVGRTVWGPVAVPASTTGTGMRRWVERLAIYGLRWIARRFADSVDIVVSTNRQTKDLLGEPRRLVEPNIFVDPAYKAGLKDQYLLTYCGLLTQRKRPWLAVQAMADPRLSQYTLQIVGDGPLEYALRNLVTNGPAANRIRFLGRLDHDSAQAAIARSRLLIHPSAREGAAWVIGEADAQGVQTVVISGCGAESTVLLSSNRGFVANGANSASLQQALADMIVVALGTPYRPVESERWKSSRISHLLDEWWVSDDF